MTSTHWTIIANPISGRGRAERVGERIAGLLRRRGVGADLMVSKARGDCERLTREGLAGGARQVAACGGDGTIHEAINGLAHSDAVLGIVPCGRGNDLARALGLPKDVNGAVDALVDGRVRAMDLGKIGDRFFATVASLGFDTAVARRVRAQTLRLGGTMAYGLAILQTLVGYRASRVRLIGDFGVFDGRVLLAATANTPFYGGGIKVAPSAVLDDGVLNVCMVSDVPRWRVLQLLSRAYAGTHVGHPEVQVAQTEILRIEADDPMWIFADGEPVCETPATVEIVPNGLKVKVTKDGE